MNNMPNNNMPSSTAKKSNALNIIIIVLVLALIAVFALTKHKAGNDVNVNTDDSTATSTPSGANTGGNGASVPEPVGAWTSSSIKTDITFDVPPNYYVSYPVIGQCRDVVSIATQTASTPTVPVALIYKEGCVTDTEVTSKYTYREVKNGYVFQTNSSNPTVVSLYNRIVASAK